MHHNTKKSNSDHVFASHHMTTVSHDPIYHMINNETDNGDLKKEKKNIH